jgi:hypothetical protein
MNPASFIDKAFLLLDQSTAIWHKKESFGKSTLLYNKILLLHLYNFKIWHFEDKIRNPSAKLTAIAKLKKQIDLNNQKRNNQIEIIDRHFVDLLRKRNIKTIPNATGYTENPGSTLDRMSVLSLRIYHLNEELNRNSCEVDHKFQVKQKLTTLFEQKVALSGNFKYQLTNLFNGKARLSLFYAIKLYNNAKLNPEIYKNLTFKKKN